MPFKYVGSVVLQAYIEVILYFTQLPCIVFDSALKIITRFVSLLVLDLFLLHLFTVRSVEFCVYICKDYKSDGILRVVRW